MDCADAGPELERALREIGFFTVPALDAFLPTYTNWAARPVDGVTDPDLELDVLRFESILDCGEPTGDVRFRPAFRLEFVRILTMVGNDDETYAAPVVRVTIGLPVTDSFRAISTMRYPTFGRADLVEGLGGPQAGAWADEVATTASFTQAEQTIPIGASMYFDPASHF